MTKFSDNLRKMRKAKGLKLHEVAKATGLSTSYLALIETGGRSPPSFRDNGFIYRRLAEVLDCTLIPDLVIPALMASETVDITNLRKFGYCWRSMMARFVLGIDTNTN